MVDEDFWRAVEQKNQLSSRPNRVGVLNIALLFGTAAIALSLILTPLLSNKTGFTQSASTGLPDKYDTITTGSIKKDDGVRRYTIRRSVLQDQPGSVCIVNGYGASGPGC